MAVFGWIVLTIIAIMVTVSFIIVMHIGSLFDSTKTKWTWDSAFNALITLGIILTSWYFVFTEFPFVLSVK